jgi:hypothetical protein
MRTSDLTRRLRHRRRKDKCWGLLSLTYFSVAIKLQRSGRLPHLLEILVIWETINAAFGYITLKESAIIVPADCFSAFKLFDLFTLDVAALICRRYDYVEHHGLDSREGNLLF